VKTPEMARIGDIANQIRGVSYSKNEGASTKGKGLIPILRANNITAEGLTFEDLVYVPRERVGDSQLLRCNDVLIAASSGSIDVVGKSAQVTEDLDVAFGAFCKVLRPGDRVDGRYFGHFFKTSSYRSRISALAQGANINNIRNEHLDDLELRMPTISEQRRLAEVLDSAEALRAKRRATLTQLDALTQSLFLDLFGDPKFNERKWPLSKIGSVISDLRGGANLAPEDFVESGFPILHKGAIKPNGTVALDAKKKTFATPEYATAHRRSQIDRKYLAVTLRDLVPTGPSIGLIANLQDGPFDNYLLAQGAYGFLLDRDKVTPEYLVYLSNMPSFRHILRKYSVGSTQIHIRTPVYLEISIPVPPISIQHEFSRRVVALKRLRASQQSSLRGLNLLFSSLQTRTFIGGL
jgi:type I restriction enzyme S subunit